MDLEVKRFVAVEDEHESSELIAEGLHRFRFPCSGRTERWPTETRGKRLRHGQVTPLS